MNYLPLVYPDKYDEENTLPMEATTHVSNGHLAHLLALDYRYGYLDTDLDEVKIRASQTQAVRESYRKKMISRNQRSD
jgi:hypothetical protein